MISSVKRPNTSPAMLAQLKLKLSKAQPSIKCAFGCAFILKRRCISAEHLDACILAWWIRITDWLLNLFDKHSFHYNYIIPPPHHAIWENCHPVDFLTFSILNYLFLMDLNWQQCSFHPFFLPRTIMSIVLWLPSKSCNVWIQNTKCNVLVARN